MTIDEKIFFRNEAYRNKDFTTSDRLRTELEQELVFIFDHLEDKQKLIQEIRDILK